VSARWAHVPQAAATPSACALMAGAGSHTPHLQCVAGVFVHASAVHGRCLVVDGALWVLRTKRPC
jgi:hypothetical protein